MAFSTGNCKMQHPIEMFIGVMLWWKEDIHFYETICTIYLCSYQKRLFPALLKKGCLKYRNLWGYKKQVDICSKNCGLFRSYVLLPLCGDKIHRMFVNLYFAILNTQYHIEIWDNLSQEVFGKHINTSAQVSNSLKLSKKLQLTAKEFFRTELLLVRDTDGDTKLNSPFNHNSRTYRL